MNNEETIERLTTPETNEEELSLEICLRPQELQDFVGQQPIKQNLDIAIQAAKKRKDPLEHILL